MQARLVGRQNAGHQIRVQVRHLRKEIRDIALACQVQGHVDGGSRIVGIDQDHRIPWDLTQADRGVDGERRAARAALGAAKDDDTTEVRAGFRRPDRHPAPCDHLTHRPKQLLGNDGLGDKTARTQQDGVLRGFERVLPHEDEKCGSGQTCCALANQLGRIDIPQGVIHDDQMRGQIRGADHGEVRPRATSRGGNPLGALLGLAPPLAGHFPAY